MDIAHCVRTGSFAFELGSGEPLGIVAPVYFRGVPMIVTEFLRKLDLARKQDTYSYVVLNCGGKAFAAEKFITPLFQVQAIFDVATVGNYVPMYRIDSGETVRKKLDRAGREIDEIITHIKARDAGAFRNHTGRAPRLVSALSYVLYQNGRKTRKFTVKESCTGCGICAEVCPRRIIKLESGKPVWTAPQCEICLACLHRCPESAIRYGKRSEGHGQYLNPRVRF